MFLLQCILIILVCVQDGRYSTETAFLAKGFEGNNGYHDFFDGRTADSLKKLKYHPNLKISVVAAWLESCEHMKTSSIENGSVEQRSERRSFLRFLSGRINCPLPSWWEKEIEEYDPSHVDVLEHETFCEELRVRHTNDFELLSLSNDEIVIKRGMETLTLEWDKDYYYPNDDTKKVRALSVFTHQDMNMYSVATDLSVLVYIADAKTGEVFHELFLSPRCQVVFSPTSFLDVLERHFVQNLVLNGNVYVFGANSEALYMYVVDIETGACICNFTTKFAPPVFLDKNQPVGGE